MQDSRESTGSCGGAYHVLRCCRVHFLLEKRQGDKLTQSDMRDQEIQELRDRLSRLSEASLRITEDLDFNSVLQGVLDSARSLTGARYGVIALHNDEGVVEDFLSSGRLRTIRSSYGNIPDWPQYFAYLSRLPDPLRIPDLLTHLRVQGLPELRPPIDVSEKVSFLVFPVLHRRERVGSIYLAEKEGGREFTREDEETLALFASRRQWQSRTLASTWRRGAPGPTLRR